MTREQVPWENDIRARCAMAFREAMVQSNRSANVVIHVGQDVYRWMKSQAKAPAGHEVTEIATYHGFPVIEEPAWATEEIRVSSSVRIP